MFRTAEFSQDSGFSLIEAMTAAAILSLGLAAYFSGAGDGLMLSNAAGERTQAALEARSLIDRMGADLPLTPGE